MKRIVACLLDWSDFFNTLISLSLTHLQKNISSFHSFINRRNFICRKIKWPERWSQKRNTISIYSCAQLSRLLLVSWALSRSENRRTIQAAMWEIWRKSNNKNTQTSIKGSFMRLRVIKIGFKSNFIINFHVENQ